MEQALWAAVIAAIAAVLAPSVSFYWTKRAERSARWRDEKLVYYKELLASLSDIVGSALPEQKERWAHATNTIQLIASPKVVAALHALLDEIAETNTNRPSERHDTLLSELILAIRIDLAIPRPGNKAFKARLWASGAR